VLSVRTVESHRASLLRKLGRPTRDELVLHARLRGLLADDGSALPHLA
jgi:DNA-binding CsgD family transcriptional regulator